MRKIAACMLALLIALAAPQCALAEDAAGEPAAHAESPAPAPADAPDPASGPALGTLRDAGLRVAQAGAADAVEVTGDVSIEATIEPAAAEETDAEQSDESSTEAESKASKPKLRVSVSAPSPSIVRPLREPLQLTVMAECAKDAEVDLTIRLGKKGVKYALFGMTNSNLTLSIPAADVNALDAGNVGVFASFKGGAGIQKLAASKVSTLSLQDNQYCLSGDKQSLHHEATSGLPMTIDVPLTALVDVPDQIPSGTLTIGKHKFTSALPGAPNALRFELTAAQLDAIAPGAYDMLIDIPKQKANNMSALKNCAIGTMVVIDPRVLPVYVGSSAEIHAEHGSSKDVYFNVKFSSMIVESVQVEAGLTRDGKSYPVDVSGFVTLDGEASELTIDGSDLKKLKMGKYTLAIGTQGSASNQPSEMVKRDLIVGGAPSIKTKKLPGASVGKAYKATIKGRGYPAPTFKLADGNLPGGLTLSSSGEISGTPESGGTYEFSVLASNGFEPDVKRTFTIAIDGAVADSEDIFDEATPLSFGDGLPVLPEGFQPKGDAVDGTATLCGLEAPLLISLVREQGVSAAELLQLMRRATGSGVPINTAQLPAGGAKLPLACDGRYVGWVAFAPARDVDGAAAVRFEISLIPGTSIISQDVDGERVPDVRLRVVSDSSDGEAEMLYVEPTGLLKANGLELVELIVGIRYHPDSSPEYTPNRVTTDQIQQLG